MKNRNFFYIGAGLGLALGYFLNTKKGKDMRRNGVKIVEDSIDQVRENGSEFIQKATETASTLKEKGNEYLESMNQPKVSQDEIESFINEKVDTFRESLAEEIKTRKFSTNHINA